MSNIVFTQGEAKQFKEMLAQVQNAAMDLAKKNETIQAEADKLAAAALSAWSGWEGQHEIGERWHDEVDDMDALGLALAAYKEVKP